MATINCLSGFFFGWLKRPSDLSEQRDATLATLDFFTELVVYFITKSLVAINPNSDAVKKLNVCI